MLQSSPFCVIIPMRIWCFWWFQCGNITVLDTIHFTSKQMLAFYGQHLWKTWTNKLNSILGRTSVCLVCKLGRESLPIINVSGKLTSYSMCKSCHLHWHVGTKITDQDQNTIFVSTRPLSMCAPSFCAFAQANVNEKCMLTSEKGHDWYCRFQASIRWCVVLI